jgi:hypothetical protein
MINYFSQTYIKKLRDAFLGLIFRNRSSNKACKTETAWIILFFEIILAFRSLRRGIGLPNEPVHSGKKKPLPDADIYFIDCF